MKLKKNFFKNLSKPIIIGEISANHNGSLRLAKKLIKCAKNNKLDFVKLQTYEPESMTINSHKKDFLIKTGIWKNQSLWNLYKKAQTPFHWQKELFSYAKEIGIKCFSTPFDEKALDILENLDCPMYKVSSFEMTHLPLIEKIAKTKKPMIISTGMASLKEIDETVDIVKKYGNKDFVLLYCVSNYPADIKEFNLKSIKILKERYKCVVGLSDHSTNNDVAKLSLSFGSMVIEKHIALSNQKKGFDIKFSLKGQEILNFRNEVNAIYNVLNNKKFFQNDKKSKIHRRSIYSIKKIKKGEYFSKDNIKIIRPGYGFEPKYFNSILGKKAKFNIDYASAIKKKYF